MPSTSYADICGQDPAVRAVRELLELLMRHAGLFEAVGASPRPSGVILAGPRGTGKTLLARAVAEIRAITPAPDLVLFAGDLAHDGNAKALALGREILSDLHPPLLLVRGEGDGPPEGYTSWNRLFSDTRFAHHIQGINIIGIDTAWRQTPRGPAFALGESQCCSAGR